MGTYGLEVNGELGESQIMAYDYVWDYGPMCWGVGEQVKIHYEKMLSLLGFLNKIQDSYSRQRLTLYANSQTYGIFFDISGFKEDVTGNGKIIGSDIHFRIDDKLSSDIIRMEIDDKILTLKLNNVEYTDRYRIATNPVIKARLYAEMIVETVNAGDLEGCKKLVKELNDTLNGEDDVT